MNFFVCYESDDNQRILLSFREGYPSWEDYGVDSYYLTQFDFESALKWCRMMNDSEGFCYPLPIKEYPY